MWLFQLGNGSFSASTEPVFLKAMAEESLVSQIACGSTHTCVTGVKDGMWTWGNNEYCQLGHSDGIKKVAEPTRVNDMTGREVKFIGAG